MSQLVASFQRDVIDPYLAQHYSPSARPNIRLTWKPLRNDMRPAAFDLIKTIISQPGNPLLATTSGATDSVDVPIAESRSTGAGEYSTCTS